MSSNNEPLLIKALKRLPVSRTPVWIMRQAGRYLPEYRAVREKAGDFMTLCRTPDLACEVTLQPLRRFSLDAAILFSDILTIPDAMGLDVSFIEGEGPVLASTIQNMQDVLKLPLTSLPDRLDYVFKAVQLIRQEMPRHLPLIGFSGSPWTLACYMVQGRGRQQFVKAMKLMQETPDVMHALLQHLTLAVTNYLIAQVRAGSDAVMLFDTWGGLLSTSNFETFSCAYLTTIISDFKAMYPNIPIIVFTKGGGSWLTQLVGTGCDALGLDWTVSLCKARQTVGQSVALQGNLNPAILMESPERIRSEVAAVLADYGHGCGHVFNLGHGITPEVPPEHVAVMVDAVRTFSPSYHIET